MEGHSSEEANAREEEEDCRRKKYKETKFPGGRSLQKDGVRFK